MAYPTLEATDVLADTANVTTHNVPWPAPAGGILANDIAVCFCGMDAASSTEAHTYPGGWSRILQDDSGSSVVGSVAWIRCAGGETGTFAVTTPSQGGGFRVLLIRGAHTTQAVEGTLAFGSSANPNPPLHTASWGAEDNYWITAAMNDGNVAITAADINWSNFGNTRWANTAGAGVATATRSVNVASQDPGTFTMATEQWVAVTVAIRPSGVAAYSLDAQPASFAVTAAAAGVVADRVLNAQPATYAFTPIQAGVLADRVLNAAPATYQVLAEAAGIVADRLLNAQPAAYAVTGFNADLVFASGAVEYVLNAEPASYSVTALQAGVIADRVLRADPATFDVSAVPASVLADRVLVAAAAEYIVSAVEAGLIPPGAPAAQALLRMLTGMGR